VSRLKRRYPLGAAAALGLLLLLLVVVRWNRSQSPPPRPTIERLTGVIHLPRGVLELSEENTIPAAAHDLEITGDPAGTVLRMSGQFRGRALFVCAGGRRIRFTNFTINGNREALEQRTDLPPSNVPFAGFTRANGILAEGVDALDVTDVNFRNIAGFAVLASRSKNVILDRLRVDASGSRNASGRNNTTGGILLEEGTKFFHVRNCELTGVLGNGIWTHSLYTSPRNGDGEITNNRFRDIGRDAIQIGHATKVTVEGNSGSRIGYPVEAVDREHGGIPVAIDTAGNVDQTTYVDNRFQEVNGKCIDLDGFHDGEIRGNSCVNQGGAAAYPDGNFGIVMNNSNPDMQSERIRITDNQVEGALYGGIFVIGSDNTVSRNRLRRLNLAHSTDDLLRAGIYLGKGAARPAPARHNTIRDNQISGFNLRCVAAAPGIKAGANRTARNVCGPEK
jgi:hypothetical protein